MELSNELKGYISKDVQELVELMKKIDFLCKKMEAEMNAEMDSRFYPFFSVQVNNSSFTDPRDVFEEVKACLDSAGIDYAEEVSDISVGEVYRLCVDGLEIYAVHYLTSEELHNKEGEKRA